MRSLVGIGLVLAFFGSASVVSAADLVTKARPTPYDPCGVSRFSGHYVGGNLGTNAYTADRSDLDGFLTDNSAWTSTRIGGSVGVQAGWDWQSCRKVLGVVGDFNWTNVEALMREEPNSPPVVDQSFRSRMHWYSTIRARAGLAVDDTLFYVTGGVAAAKITTTISEIDAVNNDRFALDKTRWGWTGGAGVEFRLPSGWSVNTEVLYMQFAKQNVTLTTPTQPGPFSFDLNDSAWVGRVGLNYRWGSPAGPMPAKGGAEYPCGPTRFNGGYVGGNVGAASYTADRNDLNGFLTDNSGWSASKTGFTGGVQIGFDWQSCHRVLGVIADANWVDVEAVTRNNPNAVGTLDSSIVSKMDWFSTVRGRAGLAVDDTLIYVTGGLARANITTRISDIFVVGPTNDRYVFESGRWGWTGGVGAEFMLWNGWSLNSELLYMQFAKNNVTLISPNQGTNSFDLNDSAWVSRFALNYRWGNAAAMPAKAATSCGPARFTGFYVGANVGANNYTADRNDLDGFLTDNSGWSATKAGATAGGQVGYDWQSCNKVVGVVADLNWTDVEAITRDNPNAIGTVDSSIVSRMDWFGTLRTRTGLAVNDTLVYVTGGLAAAKIKTIYSDILGPPVADRFAFDKTRWGWTGGVGAEFAFGGGWSVNTEVLYLQFRKETVTFTTPFQGTNSFDNYDSAWVGRVGVNYRWGGPV